MRWALCSPLCGRHLGCRFAFSVLIACATARAPDALDLHVPLSDDRRPASCPANAAQHALMRKAGDCFDLMPDLSSVWNGSCVYGPRGGHVGRSGCHEQGEHGREGRLCGGHGVCFFGACFCEPGFNGSVCTNAAVFLFAFLRCLIKACNYSENAGKMFIVSRYFLCS